MLLSRYSNIEYIMNLDASDGIELIKEAINQDAKDKLYKLYVQVYPSMNKDNYMTFEEFCKRSIPNKRKRVSVTYKSKEKAKEEAMSNVENIIKNYKI